MKIANRPVLSRTAHALVLSAAASLALLLMLVAGSDTIVQAQTPDTPTPETTQGPGDWDGVENLPPIEGKLNPPKYPNMDSNLNRIVEQVQTGQFSAQAAAANTPIHREESVAVTLYITEGYAQDVWDYLEQSGASPRNIGIDYIEAYVPVTLLPDASTQEGVVSIRTIIPSEPAQSAVVSEGVATHGASAWHDTGIRGQGVKIGIIDSAFDGFSSLMGTELPSTVLAKCYTAIGVSTSNLAACDSHSKHGTAVTETVFDIAPEATYYIANPLSFGDLQTAVDWMLEQDVDVINMSVNWSWDGSGGGGSPYSNSPLRILNTAVRSDVTWITVAGNQARNTWFGPFSDADSDGWHGYAGGDECNGVILDAGKRILIQLRWEDTWPSSFFPFGAGRNIDLFLNRGTTTVASSRTFQFGGGDDVPLELISYTPIVSGTYCIGVNHSSFSLYNAPPDWIQFQVWYGSSTLEHYSLNGSIGNPAESSNSGMLAAGAASWNTTNTIESFSSRGPTPDDRTKPDIVGVDRTKTVSYGTGEFYGTSASASHVAGLAALVKQRFPDYTPHQVTNYLKTHAESRGSVPNNTWGYGFAKLAASDAATPTPEPTPLADPCIENLEADSTIQGSWSDDCPSESRAGNYARFYTFTLDEPSDVVITLESALDTYLYVREGAGRDGSVVDENNDHDTSEFSLPSTTDSGISESLSVGTYTIEATTFAAGVTGEFTLTISGITDVVVDDNALLERYDANNNSRIDKDEALAAINDYLFGEGDQQITKAQVLEVINLYLFG